MRSLFGRISFLLFVAGGAAWGNAAAQSAEESNARGVELYNANEWVASIEAFERAYVLAPDVPTIRRNLSNAYRSYANALSGEKELSAAIELLENAISVDAENPLPLIQLGSYYLRNGRVAIAILRLEEAIQVDPENVDAHFLLGEAYYRDNDVPHALRQWEWVEEIQPGRKGLAERMEKAYREDSVEYDFAGLSSTHFNISYDREIRPAEVRAVLRILEKAYRDIGRSLGHVYPPEAVHVTLYSAEGFLVTTQVGDHVGALYDGTKIRVPTFDSEGKILDTKELERRLYHEYVHVIVRQIAKDNVPFWFNEGLAEALSHELGQTEWDLLRVAKREKILFGLEELTENQLERLDAHSLNLAYRQSHATLSLLKQRRGIRQITRYLEELATGADPEEALRFVCRYTYKTLELAVADYIGRG